MVHTVKRLFTGNYEGREAGSNKDWTALGFDTVKW